MNNDTLPPIRVVSLRDSVARRDYIQRHIDGLGLAYEIVDAVDGRRLSPDQLAAVYDAERAQRRYGRELAPEEIGCALSHLNLCRSMLEERIDEALILEDDAALGADTRAVLLGRHRFPADWGMELLYHGSGQLPWWGRRTISPAVPGTIYIIARAT